MAQSRLAQLVLARIAAWNQQHPGKPIDPSAALSVAQMEGLSGGIGDGGHAFGAFQLNNAGGVLTGKFQGQAPGQINQWAWSPQGIDYALAGIANVAGGRKGRDAVVNIVQRFERPANIPREIAGALARLGGPVQGGDVPQGFGAAQAGAPLPVAKPAAPKVNPADIRRQIALQLLTASVNGGAPNLSRLLPLIAKARAAQ